MRKLKKENRIENPQMVELKKIATSEKKQAKRFEINILKVKDIGIGVEVAVQMWKNRRQIGFSKDGSVDIERLRFVNLPVMVEDPNGDVETIQTLSDGDVIKTRYRYDPRQALLDAIEETTDLIVNKVERSKKIKKGKVGRTVTTFFALVGDGHIGTGTTSWDAARDALTGAHDTTNIQVSSSRVSATDWRITRGFIEFDTSALGTDDILSATFSIRQISRGFAFGTRTGNIVQSDKVSTTVIAGTDYPLFTNDIRLCTTDVSLTNENAWRDFVLNPAGLALVDGSGFTKYVMRVANDIDDSPVSGFQNTLFASSEHASFPPKLVVEHEAASAVGANARRLFASMV